MDVGEARTLKKQGHGSRESIREKLKQQCVNRAKQQRGNLIARLRAAGPGGAAADESMVHGLARGLVQEFAASGDSFMSCVEGVAASRPVCADDGEEGLSENDYVDLMQFLEEAVVEELRRQEQEILAQEMVEQERAEVEAWTASEHQVVCPVCLRNSLHVNLNVIFCACGVRICAQKEQISLEQLEACLHEHFAMHSSSGCPCQPVCAVQNLGGHDMLVLACGQCDFMDIVA